MEIEAVFEDLLGRHDRVVVTGGPNTGKTTLVERITDRQVFHGDIVVAQKVPWEAQPEFLLNHIGSTERFVAEGVQFPRVLRKGLEVDAVLHLTAPFGKLTAGQMTMTKGLESIMQDVLRGPAQFEVVIL